MTTSPINQPHPTPKPNEDAGTLLLALLHTTLSDPRAYTALNFGSAGQFKSVSFFRTSDGKPVLNKLNIETTTATFLVSIDEYL